MDKKSILSGTIICLIVIVLYLGFSIITKIKEKNAVEKSLVTIPKFELLSLNNKLYSNLSITPSYPVIFIFFNSECDFCQHEAQSISENLNKFKEIQIIFISEEPIKKIKQFSNKYNLNHQPKIHFLYDRLGNFSNRFNIRSIPYILIYNKNQMLIKKHNGLLSTNGILRVLQQND